MKKLIALFSIIALCVGMITAQSGKKAQISAQEVEYNFGTIKEVNGKVTHKFTIKNTGDGPLVITRVTASCGCTTPDFEKEPIAPGKESVITITYNPAGRPGPFYKTIAVYSNAKDGVLLLKIKGKVE